MKKRGFNEKVVLIAVIILVLVVASAIVGYYLQNKENVLLSSEDGGCSGDGGCGKCEVCVMPEATATTNAMVVAHIGTGKKGTCVYQCSSSQACCGPGHTDVNCADTQTDPSNCGGCVGKGGTKCKFGQRCENGGCVCPPGQSNCCPFGQSTCDDSAKSCIDTTTSPTNCGSCGHACSAGFSCISSATGGTCGCGGGKAECESPSGVHYCADLGTSTSDCGSCNHPCPTGTSCINEHCIVP